MAKIVIIDYGMGNLDSVARAIEYCGGFPIVTNKKEEIETATHIILPGVGAFSNGMENLKKTGLDEILREQIFKSKIPLLGICLGMQLLGTKGYEGGETNGLNFIEGEVKKLQPKIASERIPHIGWNEVILKKESLLFKNISSGKDFYFVHSYHFICNQENNVIALTPYCGNFISAIQKDNIFGVQFHPEKSQKPGFQILKNFLEI